MADDVLIQVDQLQRRYADKLAVDQISFSVKRGEVLGLLGPNGAGKSTTMQIIAGTLAPSGGQVLINGIDILDQPVLAKRQIGFLPEIPPLYPELSVDEYLYYAARLRGVAAGGVAAAVASTKQRCGLDTVGRRLIGNLSKGYQQRVGIAQAIVHGPLVVILDEPTVGLDPNQIREIRQLILELGQDHSVILSTHILPEVQAVCDRVQIIHQGRLVLNQSLSELSQDGPQHQYRVAFARMPDATALASLEGVDRAEKLPASRWLLHCHSDPRIELVRQAVQQDWQLLELSPVAHNLEQVFVQLTTGDAAPDKEQAA